MSTESTTDRTGDRENVSALVDGELDESEAQRMFRRLAGDEHLRAAWERYHLIGACLRREPLTVRASMARSIAARVADHAREAQAQQEPRSNARGVPAPLRRSLALAASVLVLLAGGQTVSHLWQERQSTPAMQSASTSLGSGPANGTRWQTGNPETEKALNVLLVEHGEFTSVSAMNGLASYTKFVSYDAIP